MPTTTSAEHSVAHGIRGRPQQTELWTDRFQISDPYRSLGTAHAGNVAGHISGSTDSGNAQKHLDANEMTRCSYIPNAFECMTQAPGSRGMSSPTQTLYYAPGESWDKQQAACSVRNGAQEGDVLDSELPHGDCCRFLIRMRQTPAPVVLIVQWTALYQPLRAAPGAHDSNRTNGMLDRQMRNAGAGKRTNPVIETTVIPRGRQAAK
ncbi:hypothetical protein DFH09DRAFT_1103463 [Mycena vulgaris]|nr:hypothetical protein DFH09DRAFT_1103463 [Mycena vulgaris]